MGISANERNYMSSSPLGRPAIVIADSKVIGSMSYVVSGSVIVNTGFDTLFSWVLSTPLSFELVEYPNRIVFVSSEGALTFLYGMRVAHQREQPKLLLHLFGNVRRKWLRVRCWRLHSGGA
jgi:hypothetical protein